MNKVSAIFPAQFAQLADHAEWALPQREARYKKRLQSTQQEIKVFYDAVLPRMKEIIEYLNSRSLQSLSAEEGRLLMLAQAWMDASRAIEIIGAPDVKYGLEASRFKVRDVVPI